MPRELVLIATGGAVFVAVVILTCVPDPPFMRQLYVTFGVRRAIPLYDGFARFIGRVIRRPYCPPKRNDRRGAAWAHLTLAVFLASGLYLLRSWFVALLFLDIALGLMLYATFMLKFLAPRHTIFDR